MAGGNPKLERDTLSGPLPGLSQPQSTFRAGGGVTTVRGHTTGRRGRAFGRCTGLFRGRTKGRVEVICGGSSVGERRNTGIKRAGCVSVICDGLAMPCA